MKKKCGAEENLRICTEVGETNKRMENCIVKILTICTLHQI
jgi:hypothetical protein